MRSALRQAVIFVIMAALALLALHVLGGLDRIGQLVNSIRRLPSLRPPVLAAAIALDLCAALMLGVLWTRLLERLGHRVPFSAALAASLSSGLAGYLDNLVGSAAGAALSLRGHGVSAGRAVLLTALAYMIQFCGILVWAPLGLVVVAQTHVGASLPIVGKASTYALAIMLGGMLAVMVLLLRALAAAPSTGNALAQRLLGRQRTRGGPALQFRHLLLLIPCSSAAWLSSTLALLALLAALFPAAAQQPATVIGAGALAYVFGALAFFMPEGLGVRDGILLGLLVGAIHLPLAQATLAVVAVRAIDTCTKLGLLLAVWVGSSLTRSRNAHGRCGAAGARRAPATHQCRVSTRPGLETADEAVA